MCYTEANYFCPAFVLIPVAYSSIIGAEYTSYKSLALLNTAKLCSILGADGHHSGEAEQRKIIEARREEWLLRGEARRKCKKKGMLRNKVKKRDRQNV